MRRSKSENNLTAVGKCLERAEKLGVARYVPKAIRLEHDSLDTVNETDAFEKFTLEPRHDGHRRDPRTDIGMHDQRPRLVG